jgi:PKD repeat protein
MVASLAGVAYAENDQVIIVPFSQQNPQLPHPAHEGAPITLKGIVRNAQCGSYKIRWDINQNGNFDDDDEFTANRNGTSLTVRDIGRGFVVPNVSRDKQMNINVRVRSNCGGPDKFGTFKLFVYDFTPSNDPRNWSDEQIEIMASMAIQEAMWYLHRELGCISGRNSASIEACAGHMESTGIGQWLFVINNHLPAYPPESLAADEPSPDGWLEENARRWNVDPLAESAMRLLNYNVARGSSTGINRADERDHPRNEDDGKSTCGYRGGRELRCDRIPGTLDGQGIYARHSNVYRTGQNTGAISTVLPALYGTKIKVGPGAGKQWNWYVQELVDYLGYQQIDGGCGNGGWYYGSTDGNGSCGASDLSTTQWAYIGLESAEIAGGPYGVFVNNRHKYRIANTFVRNQQSDGGAAYDNNGGRSDHKLTGGQLLAGRWLGAHKMSRTSNSTPFSGKSDHSQSTLRSYYDNYLSFTVDWFNSRRLRGTHWQDGMWQQGSYLCDDTNGVYNQPKCGHTYSLYSHQKAYHTGSPEVHHVGGNDWYRMFATYYIRAQDRYARNNDSRWNYGSTGSIMDTYCETTSVTCHRGGRSMNTIMGGLVLTPAVFNPKPVAQGAVSTTQVTEGCVPGNGSVVFTHDESFHPNSDSQIVSYMWDADASNGLWWETGASPDLDENGDALRTADPLAGLTYIYMRRGTYTPTLRVEDQIGQQKTVTLSQVTVGPADDVPPSIATGGPYLVEVGSDLVLNGSATDGNLACGDKLSVSWNIDYEIENPANRTFEVNGEKPTVPWASLQNLPRNQALTIQVQVRDQFAGNNEAPIETTNLFIYDRNPVVVAKANPTQAACRQQVTFDASDSFHPNPRRTLANFQWEVDGRTSDRAIYTTNFASFGPRVATITVTDDLGRSSSTTVDVNINQGNLPPTIRVPSTLLTVMSNETINLDARQSFDPNADCGDRIVAYEWDMRADGVRINGAAGADFTGAQVQIPVADWQAAMGWDGNDDLLIRLTVRDAQGASSTQDIHVNAVRAEPVPEITQVPNPASFSVGRVSSVRIDGRESSSLLQGVTISRYEWDIGCDGSFDREGGQFLYERTFPEGTTEQSLAANPVIACLRVTDSNGNVAVSAPYPIAYQQLGNTSPFADADPSDAPEVGYNLLEGEGVTLDASSSFDPDSQDFDDYIREYAWTVNGQSGDVLTKSAIGADDAAAQTIELSAAQLAGMGIAARGEYAVSLRVTDTQNNQGSDVSTLTIHRSSPEISVIINPVNTSPNSRVTFDASRSEHTHPDINITETIWFFGDLIAGGACTTDQDCAQGYCIVNPADDALACMTASLGTQEGEVVNQTFTTITPDEGDGIQVVVVVRDSNGGQSQSSSSGAFNEGDDGNSTRYGVIVDQGNRSPVSNPGGGTEVGGGDVIGAYTVLNDGGETITFDGSASIDPDAEYGDEITRFTWRFGTCVCSTDAAIHNNCPVNRGDVGASLPTLTLAQLGQCQIDEVGSFDVTLTVTDRFGQDADTTTSLNVVSSPVALAQANPNRTGCEQIVTFDGRGSSSAGPVDQGFGIVSYEWDLDGDGAADFVNPTFSIPVTAQPTGNPPQVRLSARLTVTNEIGLALIAAGQDPGPHQSTDDITVVIDVQNLPPVADAGGPYRTGGGNGSFAPVTVDGRGSIDPNEPCDSISEYWWDTDGDNLFGCDDSPCDHTGPTISYANSNWQPNTTASVQLKVKDQFGVWSAPASADIIIDNVIPPSGELLSPRVNTCASDVGGGNSEATVLVRHPAPTPLPVIVEISVSGQVVGTQRVANYNAQKEATVTIPMNLAQVPEGLHEISAKFSLESNPNSNTTATSGGRVTFDFTGPVITLGAQPAEGVCYANGRVPDTTVDVEDNFDNAPQVSESITEDGCSRTVNVVARDYCGRETTSSRTYLVGTSVSLDVTGVSEGELVNNAQATWDVIGAAACAREIEANLSRDGGAAAPYAEGAEISSPGEYSLVLTVWNCIGTPREQVVNFRVNRPPVARPIPDGHPNSDPNGVNAYVINEGSPLTLDGLASTAPEFDDSVVSWVWDVPGRAAMNGPSVQFDTSEDGVFNGTLTVTDNLGSTHTETFQVTVRDIDPVANAGGPYIANQDEPITFDASRSRSLSPADTIVSYTWSWGDGTPDSNGQVVNHAFTAQGAYNVTLTVTDEDSSSSVIIGVIIADVDPEIESIYITDIMGTANVDRPDPMLGYEVVPVTFGVTATPGAPNDPITLYQWDFDGDQLFDETTEDPSVVWQFMEPGLYEVGVLVRDRDSFTFRTQYVDVKPVDFETVLKYMKFRLDEVMAGDLNIINRARLANTGAAIDKALWAQRHDGLSVDAEAEYNEGAMDQPDSGRAERVHVRMQGVSFSASERILSDFSLVQANGVDFGTAIWSLSRQLRRELDYDYSAVSADTEGLYSGRSADPMYSHRMSLSDGYLSDVVTLYEDDGFERDTRDLNAPQGLALDLQSDARRGLDWLSIAVDQCSDPRFLNFEVNEDERNIAAYSEAAEAVRVRTYDALDTMLTEMMAYAATGGDADPAPGRDRMADAAQVLTSILSRADLNMTYDCQQDCSDNSNALEIELEAMDLIAALQSANAAGVYVMPWQSCLVEYLRFRIEASLVAVRSWCGMLNPLYLKAKEVFKQGESLLVDQDDILGALNFYSDDEQRCLILDVYNKCLVRVDPDSDYYAYPDVCLE